MSKSHASIDECLLLVRLKREKAVASMREIVVKACQPPHAYPDIMLILEYLNNMAYCLEMMLKLLSNDWRSHKVGQMYEKAFGVPHPNQAMMDNIETALRDQKYLFEPSGGLLAQIEGLEKLHDQLTERLSDEHKIFVVQRQIEAPQSLLKYLRDNLTRFYSEEGVSLIFEDGETSADALAKFEADLSNYCDEIRRGLHNESQEMRSYLDRLIKGGQPLVFFNGRQAVI